MRDHEPRYPRTLADLGRLLSCEVRLEVFASVLQGGGTGGSVGALAERLSLDMPLVSTHLAILRRAPPHVLSCTAEKRIHIYSPGPTVRLRAAADGELQGRDQSLVAKLRARDGSELLFRLPPPEQPGRGAAASGGSAVMGGREAAELF